MKVKTLSRTYRVCTLTQDDAQRILAIYQSNPQYFDAMQGRPSLEGVMHDLNALPDGKTTEAKYYLGICDGEKLIAVLDLIDGYPAEGTAFIGLFMVDANLQGQGIGTRIVGECLSALAGEGYHEVRLGFVEGNKQSEAFWKKNGFLANGVRSRRDGYTVVVACRRLSKETDAKREDGKTGS